tara:strand:+ start:8364 stop:8699 length:336 start_codon:yes stop_codon:yes gene_type:complete
MQTAQEIFDELKSADNKKFWAFAQELSTANRRLAKLKEKLKSVDGIDFSNKEKLKTLVLEHLLKESAKGNAQASDKLAKLAGLSESEQDIIIEIVNYNPPKKVKKKSIHKK